MSTLSDQQVRDILQQGESQTVEFKRDLIRPEMLARLMCAFGNADGGMILVGVDERRGPVGCNSQQMMRVFEAAQRRLKDGSSASMYFHRIDGLEIAIIRVAKAPRLVSCSDGVFIRRGEAVVAMSALDIGQALSPQPQKAQIDELVSVVSEQTRTIEELREEIRLGGSWKSKIKD